MLDFTWIECFFDHIHNENILIISILALEKIQAVSETTNMNNFRIEDELFTGIFRHKAGIDRIGIYPDIVQAMLKDKPVHGAKDYQVGIKSKIFRHRMNTHAAFSILNQKRTECANEKNYFEISFGIALINHGLRIGQFWIIKP